MQTTRISLSKRNIVAISGLLLLLILSVVFSRGCGSSAKTTEPPLLAPGTFNRADLVEPLVSKSIEQGKIFFDNAETDEIERLVLKPDGIIELLPGNWRLQTIWDLDNNKSVDGAQFRFVDPEFSIRSGQPLTHDMLIQLPHSWKHPKLPAVSGATATWQGTFNRKPGNAGAGISYILSMTTMNELQIAQCPCRWLHVEVESDSPAGAVTESAYLAVDVEAWEKRQQFVVKKGWIMADSTDIEAELKTPFSGDSGKPDHEAPTRITVDFISDRDVLAKNALELEAPLPDERLSLLDALTLVMDAGFHGASPEALALRKKLSDLDVQLDKHVEVGSYSSLSCLAVRSRIVSDELQFELLRNDALVPFSFVKVEIKDPTLEASLNLSTYSQPEADITSAPVPEEKLAMDAERIRTLPGKPRFDLATIPKKDGAWIKYGGFIEFGSNLRSSYDATVSTLGTEERNGKLCRWLKLEVSSGAPGPVSTEAAIVLVDPAGYQLSGKASILDGWLIYGNDEDHVLKFDADGDMKQTGDDLQMLECPLSPERLSAHDVLALLFNAELKQSQSKFILLRRNVEDKLKDSTGRKMTRRDLKLKNGRVVPGKVWEFKGDRLEYTFERSDAIPFSFFSMNLTYGPVKLFSNLESNVQEHWDPASFDENKWEQRAQETQARVSEWREQHPNYLFWTIATTKQPDGPTTERRLLAEWAGESKPPKGAVKGELYFLKLLSGDQISCPSETQPAAADKKWIAGVRHWEKQNMEAQYVPSTVPSTKPPAEITLKVRGADQVIPWGDLSPDDQVWVKQANRNWQQPVNPRPRQ